MKKGEVSQRAPLAAQYGNWIVQGEAFRDEVSPGKFVWKAPCVCHLHGTRRDVPEAELRMGKARRCMACVRTRTAVLVMPRRSA